ncbi:MAG: response regulator [Desulfuromonadales bacterium]|nr:response regulator [Desulfuromonadales bacterium]
MRRTKKMEAIGLMAGGVAHDLNNVLAAIISYPELMLRKLPDDHPLRRQLKEIQSSGQRAAGIVNDLLTIARGVVTSREPHDIHSIIEDYVASAEHKKLTASHPHVDFVYHCQASDSCIECSPIHISKVLMNLITNAFEAVDGQGKISVSTTNAQQDQLTHFEDSITPDNYLLLKIQDSGSGIAEKDLEHIFEPFYTTKMMGQSGTGLGLSMVWNIIQDHDGHISVSSNKKGTTFELIFPVSQQQSVDIAEGSNKNSEHQGNQEHILVVDDEQQLRDLTAEILKVLNYRVSTVSSGEEAISFLKNNDVDLAVVDMHMGAGMNGRETIEKIKALKAETKVIIASGFPENREVQKAMENGAICFINKPCTLTQFGEILAEALGTKSPQKS